MLTLATSTFGERYIISVQLGPRNNVLHETRYEAGGDEMTSVPNLSKTARVDPWAMLELTSAGLAVNRNGVRSQTCMDSTIANHKASVRSVCKLPSNSTLPKDPGIMDTL